LKSASDLNVPLVAVGIFYRMGYMTQRISASGEQIAVDAENDPGALPMELVRTADGKPLELRLQLPGRELVLRAWRVAVGRITLFLLDSNVPSNRQEDRDITKNLYGGEHETRLQQEIVLGRGGARLLRSLGIQPAAWHMNEGHAAFLTLERVGQLVKQEGLTFDEARELVRATTLFTTHTPVPAGHDSFGEDLMRRYFSDAPDWVGVPWETFIAFGRTREHTDGFNMTYLAVAFSAWRNGVSKLHGTASRQLLHGCWPGLLESEVPIRTVTNGIHLPTWTHPAVARALGVVDRPIRGEDFQAADGRTVVDLWKAKKGIKRDLIERVGVTLRRSFLERHDSPLVLNRMLDGLDENALLIGFARRFAPYKRAHLLFAEPKVLDRLLGDRERPLRILIAGKAHPKDEHGKDILRRISDLTRSDALVGRVFFIEDYDMRLARALVQGVDVWLNNPTRMLEASGTSGMKAAANGCLNLSIGDGWWPEAYDGENGWQIAGDRIYQEQELQDQFDANALYRLLEDEVVPLYFDRDEDGVPAKWLARVRRSLETVPPAFNTDRMVLEYLSHAYSGLAGSFDALGPQRKNELKALVGDLHRIRRDFQEIRFVSVEVADLSDVKVGDAIDVRVEADLGALSPDEVTVELVLGHGPSGARGQDLQLLSTVPLSHRPRTEGKTRLFECSHTMQRSGSYAYGIRVRPRCPRDAGDALGDLVRWA
jgi:starch phosphorylase